MDTYLEEFVESMVNNLEYRNGIFNDSPTTIVLLMIALWLGALGIFVVW